MGPLPVPTRASATAISPAVPSPTPLAHRFDDIDARALLGRLFPEFALTSSGAEFIVNGNPAWLMWINSRAEGQFTQTSFPELAAIVANEVPKPAESSPGGVPWGSFLAILGMKDGQLEEAHRGLLFPTAISPMVFDVKIDRVLDYDRDEQNELLITTSATRSGIVSTAAFLYEWNGEAFAEVWSAPIGEDNTGAINQTRYYSSASEILVGDLNGDRLDEIVVNATRVEYEQDAQGLADLTQESARRSERRVYRWEAGAFLLDPSRTTPLPP